MCGSGEVQANLGRPPESVKLQGWVPGWPSALMRLILYFCDVPENQNITLKPNIDGSLSFSLFLYLYLNRLGVLSVNRRSALQATLLF